MEKGFIGQHTTRCPNCNADEPLISAIRTYKSEKQDIKCCYSCGAVYVMNNLGRTLRDD